jgi:Cd2+/Zn2+-exporting ATPase/Cu+-exporting ATPase
LVYFAIGCAILTFLITQDVRSTISVGIVAGACGIAAGTPLAVLGAIGLDGEQIVVGSRGLLEEQHVDPAHAMKNPSGIELFCTSVCKDL